MEFSKSMDEFYKDHKISMNRFTKLIGVTPESVTKYANGSLDDRETKLKIEIAIQVIEDFGMVFPSEFLKEDSYQEIREREHYDEYFKRIYNRILVAEL